MTAYFEHKNGRKEDVYEGMEVWIPPVGVVWDFIEGKWVQTEVHSRSDIKEEQFWERPIDINYKSLRKRELDKQRKNPMYVDPELEAFREREWFRRLNGFWFMNNGAPTFITGVHYFYLTWWRIDVGYPSYRGTDRRFFLVWSYCEGDPNSFGLVEAARRRSGKTVRSTCIMYEHISRTVCMDQGAGIQSKTREDAAKLFAKLINSFTQLPDFFVPIYDTSSGTRPKNKLTFLAKSSRAIDYEAPEIELGGTIDFQSFENLAYDGSKLVRYLRDECGKVINADVHDGWSIVKPCLSLGTREIIGKALFTTTVEEGGDRAFKKIWRESNFLEKDKDTKRTRSGMYRIFFPAYENDESFFDRYGICHEEEAKEAMMYERAALSDSPRALASYKRKNPFNISEAFFSVNDEAIFDSLKIIEQLKVLELQEKQYVTGNFQWVDGMGSDVEFVENFNGKWNIHKGFYEKIQETPGLINNWRKFGDKYRPTDSTIRITSSDTFDHSKKNLSDERQASDAAFYTFQRHDPSAEEFDDTFLCEYIYRQPSADMMADDLLKQCVFFGSQAVIENNKPGAISFFERNGYDGFIISVDGRQGISASPKNKQSLCEVTETYIRDYSENVVFPHLLEDWNGFSLENSTAFDATMGAGWGLLVATRIGKKFQQKPEHLEKSDTRRQHARKVISKYL